MPKPRLFEVQGSIRWILSRSIVNCIPSPTYEQQYLNHKHPNNLGALWLWSHQSSRQFYCFTNSDLDVIPGGRIFNMVNVAPFMRCSSMLSMEGALVRRTCNHHVSIIVVSTWTESGNSKWKYNSFSWPTNARMCFMLYFKTKIYRIKQTKKTKKQPQCINKVSRYFKVFLID